MSDDADSGKWLKVKARMPNNQKVMGLSDAAFRMHVSVSCWCCEEINDGKFKASVPPGMPRAPDPKKLPQVIRELVDAELWRPTEDGGYEINDFLKYNMSRAQWEAMKAAGAEGGRRSGEARRRAKEATAEGGGSPSPRPVPRRPPEHDNDHEERSKNQPPPKDLIRRGDVRALTEEEEEFKPISAGERAALILAGEENAEVLKPHAWPEVQELVEIFANATGVELRILPYEHDPGVRALVVLLASFEFDRLKAALPIAVGTDFWRAKPARPLSHLSPAVVGQALAEDAEAAKVEALRLANRKRYSAPRKATPTVGLMSAAELVKAAREQAHG